MRGNGKKCEYLQTLAFSGIKIHKGRREEFFKRALFWFQWERKIFSEQKETSSWLRWKVIGIRERRKFFLVFKRVRKRENWSRFRGWLRRRRHWESFKGTILRLDELDWMTRNFCWVILSKSLIGKFIKWLSGFWEVKFLNFYLVKSFKFELFLDFF